MNLYELLAAERQALLDRWAAAAQASSPTSLTKVELVDRMPYFLDELAAALHPAVASPCGGSANAQEHGLQRLRLGFDVGEVVREYGLLHVALLELAEQHHVAVTTEEAKTLADCLNVGTCDAVRQYQQVRDGELQRQAAEHLGFIAHELRSPLSNATMAYSILRRHQPETSRVSDALGRALASLTSMIDNALAHAWLKGGAPVRGERTELGALIAAIERDVAVEAEDKGITIDSKVEPIVMQADPRQLGSAISNLVRNAIKFSHRDTTVAIRAGKHDGRVLIEVEDSCGGLPPGKSEELFSPFVQKGADRSGFGLGLAIARQAAEGHNGTIKVRNLPGKGCVFTLDLPAA